MSGHHMYSDLLKPIPGYEGVYSIHPSGVVVNKNNLVLRTFPTKQGEAIELRNRGQREKVLISELLKKLEDSHGSI